MAAVSWRRGETIGSVGDTGRATAPHLHYEVWLHDQAQNPIHFILDEYRSFGYPKERRARARRASRSAAIC